MLTFFRKKKVSKTFSITAVFLMLFCSVNPMNLQAFEGPTQPELSGFMQVSASDMVDPFTGDFSYNIPLMNVPGPDGGYPINLAYNGGTMNDESSWVGWGWSVTPGLINRQMRGVPDDFDGTQVVKKTYHEKDEHNLLIGVGVSPSEVLGADVGLLAARIGGNMNVIYNNKRGWSLKMGLNLQILPIEAEKSPSIKIEEDSGDPENSNTSGDDESCYTPGQADLIDEKKNETDVIADVQDESMSNQGKFKNHVIGKLGGASFSRIGPITAFMQYPRSTTTATFQGKIGGTLLGTTVDFPFTASYTKNKISTNNFDLKAVGYLHSTDIISENLNVLMDYSRDNESLLNRSTKIMPMPVQTHDLYQLNTQGMGGVFRAMRNDIPIYGPVSSFSSGKSASVSAEWNTNGGENKFGAGYEFGVVGSYSGKWLSGNSATQEIKQPNLHESTYFKFMGENSEHNSQYSNMADHYDAESPVMSTFFTSLGQITSSIGSLTNSTAIPFLTNLTQGLSFRNALSKDKSNPKEYSKMAKAINYITESEYKLLFNSPGNNYRGINPTDLNAGSTTISEFQVTGDEGKQLNFGIPVFTNYQEDYVYSTNGVSYDLSVYGLQPYSANSAYSASEIAGNNHNGVGREGSFSKTTTPKYAHAYLLTEILSDDYRDLDNNGPSINDLGNYTKFNWEKSHNEVDRIGSNGSNNALVGTLSDRLDDRASFSIAEKEIYYIESIETKTHKAVFEYLNDRLDALTFNKAGAVVTNPSVRKARLVAIKLYKINQRDSSTPTYNLIKTVHLNQSYNHWEGVTNSSSPGSILSGVSNARLTLDGFYTTYGESGTARVEGTNRNEYHFEYNTSVYPSTSTGTAFDKPENCSDRWGNKQLTSENEYGVSNHIIPYTNQSRSVTDNNVKEGLLKEIYNPTGGRVEIEYESDDYGYVQDRKAMRMFKISAVGSSAMFNAVAGGLSTEIDDSDQYLLFELEKPATSIEDISEYTEGINEIYFKTFMGLKDAASSANPTYFVDNGKVLDYIDGYAELDKSFTPVVANILNSFEKYPYGILKVKKKSVGTTDFHPFELAALHSLKFQRFDLRSPVTVNFGATFNVNAATAAVNNILNDVFGTIAEERGFYRLAKALNYGDDIYWKSLPSLIRLNDFDGIKLGGGARVKAVHVKDAWDSMTLTAEGESTYSKYYFYENEDGSSSGVCTFEPAGGGEDNPFKMPVKSNQSDGFFFNDNSLISTLPIGETYFPSPSIGYERVTVYTNADRSPSKYGNGIKEYGFYTAKDFPVRTSYTQVQSIGEDPIGNVMRFLGVKKFTFVGMAQGFSVVLNNMHGKPKHTSTYSSFAGLDLSTPVSRQTYHYNTSGINNKQIETSKTVIDNQYFQRSNVKLGEEMDVFMEQREALTVNAGAGGATNASVFGIIPLPSYFPRPNKAASGTKTATITKVFTQNATLDKVEHMVDGAVTIAENLMFDPYSGSSIYTKSYTPFGTPTYTKTFPAHWDYVDYRASSINLGKTFSGSEAVNFVTAGDLLLNTIDGTKVWVTDVSIDQEGTTIGTYASDATNNDISLNLTSTYKVIRSGYRNKMGAVAQIIEASKDIQDPTNRSENIYFAEWNKYVHTQDQNTWELTDCIQGALVGGLGSFVSNVGYFGDVQSYLSNTNFGSSGIPSVYFNGVPKPLQSFSNNHMITFLDPCPFYVFFPSNFSGSVIDYEIYETNLSKGVAIHKNNSNDRIEVEITDMYGLANPCPYNACVDGVYNASAVSYNKITTITNANNLVPTNASNNPYKYNLNNGFNYPGNSLTWLTTRLQSGSLTDFNTDAGVDGEFSSFLTFKSVTYGSNVPQNKWIETEYSTLRDLNGNGVESENALGIYSAQLLDFCSSHKTAVAYNARFTEIAYESFEDQSNCYDHNGNFDFTCSSCSNVYYDLDAHTGKYCFKLVNSGVSLTAGGLNLINGKDYVLRLWAKNPPSISNSYPTLNGTNSFVKLVDNIDGWSLYEAQITGGGTKTLSSVGHLLIDDVLIKPKNASMQTYVYDENTGFLLATLDNNHLAKINTYDVSGALTGIKVETNKGKESVQSSVTSYSKLNNQ